MRYFLPLIILVILLQSCSKDWEDMPHIYTEYDIIIAHPDDVRDWEIEFASHQYNAVNGILAIMYDVDPDDLYFLEDIYEVTGDMQLQAFNSKNLFKNLRYVGGNIYISAMNEVDEFKSLISCKALSIYNSELESIEGFNELVECEAISIVNGDDISLEISGFTSIEEIDLQLKIQSRNTLTKISGFSQLKTVGGEMEITALQDKAFKKLSHVDDLYIAYETGMNSFPELESVGKLSFSNCQFTELINKETLITCERLLIDNCDLLEDLSAIENISLTNSFRLMNCDKVKSLNGLMINGNLGQVSITENYQLSDFCALQGKLSENVQFNLLGNAYNPDLESIELGYCSN